VQAGAKAERGGERKKRDRGEMGEQAFPPDWRELAVQPAAREFHQLHTNLRQPINGVLRRLKIFRLREPF